MKHHTSPLNRLSFLLAFAFSLLSPAWSQAADRTWIQGTGGDFLTPENWAGGNLPTLGDSLYFDASTTDPYTVLFHDDFELRSGNTGRIYFQTGNRATFKLHEEGGESYSLSSFTLQVTHGDLTLDGGTTVANSVLTLGAGDNAEGKLKLTNGATLTGVTNSDTFRVGNSAKGTLELEERSTATFAGRFQIGYKAGAGGSSVTLTGRSTLIASAGIYLGSSNSSSSGDDAPVATSNNSLSVLNGSSVSVASYLYIGYKENANHNTVVIGGEESGTRASLNVSNNLRIGHSAGTVGNSLTVKAGGDLTSTSLVRVEHGNSLTVEEGGKATLTDTGTSNYIAGRLSIKGGEFEAGTLEIRHIVAFEAGTFEMTRHLNTIADSRFEFALDDRLTIHVGGKLTATGTTYIDITQQTEGMGPGTYTLFTSTTNATGMNHFTLGNTFEGFVGTLSYDANHLYLHVTSVPEPASVGLVLLSFPLLWRLCRRKAQANPNDSSKK